MTSLRLEIEGGDEDAPALTPPANELLGFCSFAFALRFGAQHELALAARRLKDRHAVDLRVFATYAEGVVREEADAEDLERAWQPAARVEEQVARARFAIQSGDEKLNELLADWPALVDRLAEVEARARWAAERDRRVRFTFLLE